MSNRDHRERLSRRQIQEIRKQLRERDGKRESTWARIGRIVSYPPFPSGNVRRYRFGVALLLLAIFQMLLVAVLPEDDRRWLFAGFAFLTATVAAWQIDTAKTR
jgi:hypothetical protein